MLNFTPFSPNLLCISLKAAEGGELHDVIQANRAKKDKKRQKRLQALIDDAGSPASSSEAGRSSMRGGRGNSRMLEDSDEDDDNNSGSDNDDDVKDTRKRGRPSTASVEPSLNGEDDEPNVVSAIAVSFRRPQPDSDAFAETKKNWRQDVR